MDWIACQEELPPCDGIFEVLHAPLCIQVGLAYYDGKGFLDRGDYVKAAHWRVYAPSLKKKYGKVK